MNRAISNHSDSNFSKIFFLIQNCLLFYTKMFHVGQKNDDFSKTMYTVMFTFIFSVYLIVKITHKFKKNEKFY